MLAELKIAERGVSLSATASFLLIYLHEFGEDIFPDLFPLMSSSMEAVIAATAYEAEPSDELLVYMTDRIGLVDREKCRRLIWALAKNADAKLPRFVEWSAEYPELDEIGTMIDIVGYLYPTLNSNIESKAKSKPKPNGKITTTLIMVAITARGMTVSDMDKFTVGQCVDFVVEWNNLHQPDDKPGKRGKEAPVRRRATQEDYDNFGARFFGG